MGEIHKTLVFYSARRDAKGAALSSAETYVAVTRDLLVSHGDWRRVSVAVQVAPRSEKHAALTVREVLTNRHDGASPVTLYLLQGGR